MISLDNKILEKTKENIMLNKNNRKKVTKDIEKRLKENPLFLTDTGDGKYIPHTLNGIFVSPTINWDTVYKNFRDSNYEPIPDEIGQDLEKKLQMKNIIFPFKTIKKTFPKIENQDGYVEVEISLKTGSMSKTETINHLDSVKKKANENLEWIAPITDWLNKQKINTFYYVIEFEIKCSFDIDKYLDQYESKDAGTQDEETYQTQIEKEVQKHKKTKDEIETIYETEARRQLADKASPYIKWAVEVISEKIVYPDICKIFSSSFKTNPAGDTKPSTPEGKTESPQSGDAKPTAPEGENNQANLSKKVNNIIIIYPPDREEPEKPEEPPQLPFLTYVPTDVSFAVDAVERVHIPLDQIIIATIKIVNNGSKPFIIDDNLKIVCTSEYFEIKKEELNLKKGEKYVAPINSATNEIDYEKKIDAPKKEKELSVTLGSIKIENGEDKREFIEKKVTVRPKMDEIKKKFLNKYPITFKLVRSVSFLKQEEKDAIALMDKREIELGKSEIKISLKAPEVEFSVKRTRLPHKGDQIQFLFHVKLKNENDYMRTANYPDIPMRIDCIFGPDFTPIDPTLTGDNSKIVTVPIEVPADGKKAAEKIFKLYANRAGFPGYTNKANFILSFGQWKEQSPVQRWNLSMTVLPNVFDTFVAGVSGLLGILYMYYPDVFPAFSDSLNIANLGVTPGIVYLAYRVLNWAKDTKEKPSS